MFIIALAVLIAVILIWLFLCSPNMRCKRAADYTGTKFAHRGLHSGDCAENSIDAFERACRAGYGIELDVQFTKDKQLVVFHDDNALRMTGCNRLIREMNLDEVRALRLVTDKSPIPTFREVLDTVNGRVPLLVEIKTCPGIRELTEATAAMLAGYEGRYVIESFNPFCLSALRKCAPDVIRGQLVTGRKEYLKDQAGFVAFALSQLLLNVIARPDFIAYNAKSPVTVGLWLHKKLFRTPLAAWTITDKTQTAALSAKGTMPIFEKCKP